ncbi:MAG: enoyl-CoA hydratase/isomerase family protein, partial [Rhodoplanes sp.]
VTTSATLLAEARAWAAELGTGSTTALALAKEILNKTFELSDEDVFALGRQAQAVCYTTDEHREAVKAFLAKTQR